MTRQPRIGLAAAATAAMLAVSSIAGTAAAQSSPPNGQPSENGAEEAPLDKLDEAGREALERAQELLGMLQRWWSGMPRYAAPEINEKGDIIIRRLPPKSDEPDDGDRDDSPDEEGAVEL